MYFHHIPAVFFFLKECRKGNWWLAGVPFSCCLSTTLITSDTPVQLGCFQRVKKALLAGKQHQQLPAIQLSEERADFLPLGEEIMLFFQRAEAIRVTSHLLLKASYAQSRQLDSHYPWLLVRFSKKKESPQKVFNLGLHLAT